MGARDVYRKEARAFGLAMARRGIGLVYGGGRVGLMGVVADAVLDGGAEVIGVIPKHLVAKEREHNGLSDLRVVGTMHERKALMADLADAFVALPGGFGTYDEFCEIVTWAQLGLHRKPCAMLNTVGYYDAMLEMFDHASAEGFIRPDHRAMLIVETESERLLDALTEYHAPVTTKWLKREDV